MVLVGLLIAAAWQDMRTHHIGNGLSVAIAALFVWWAGIGLIAGSYTPQAFGLAIACGAGLFAVCAGAFSAGVLGGGDVKLLAAVGLFQAAPWVLRQHIYYDGSWLNTQTLVHNPSEGPIAMLRLLPEISNSNSKRNTIKYIASQVAHDPWRLHPATCMLL